jgi:hypothetical protein
MKKLLILFFCIFALSAKAQYVDKVEEVLSLPTNPLPLHKYVYQGNVYIFADGVWNIIDSQSTSTYAITAFGGTASIDTTKILPSWQIGLYTPLTDPRLTDARIPRSHSHVATDITGTAVLTNDSRLSDSRLASDVYSWAKASVKPSYTPTEIGLSLIDSILWNGKMDSTRVNSLLTLKMNTVSLIDSTNWNAKMDSTRTNGLLALKMNTVSLIDSTNWNTVLQKMDSTRTNALLATKGVVHDTTVAWKKMDSVRVNSLLTLYALSTTVTPKMDSVRANNLFATKQNTIGNLADTTKYLKTTSVNSGAYFDTTRITYGVVTIPAGDSIQVSITGLTASSVATTAYRSPRMTADTMATWQIPANGKITIYGKYNKVIGYSVKR